MELSLKDQEHFRERLRQEMHRRQIVLQKDFAALIGISPTYLSFIFSGKRIGVRQVVNISKRLKVSIGYLLGLENLPDWFSDYLAVPLVEGRIAANPRGLIPGEAVESLIWLHRDQAGSRRHLVAVRLGSEADSMLPTLHPGDLIIIDRDDKDITPRGLYAVRLPDLESCTIKRLQLISDKNIILLLSDNPNYEPLPVPCNEHLIIGRVICSWTSWIK